MVQALLLTLKTTLEKEHTRGCVLKDSPIVCSSKTGETVSVWLTPLTNLTNIYLLYVCACVCAQAVVQVVQFR